VLPFEGVETAFLLLIERQTQDRLFVERGDGKYALRAFCWRSVNQSTPTQ
jgi:hypothetical protein